MIKLKSISYFTYFLLFAQIVSAQNKDADIPKLLKGKVEDLETGEHLPFVHIMALGKNKTATITNEKGEFAFQLIGKIDSLKFSCIGYKTYTISINEIILNNTLIVKLEPEITLLQEIVVKPLDPRKIILAAWQAIPFNYDTGIYQQEGFYREIIQDKEDYLSIAEAQFKLESNPYRGKEKARLQLIKGRTSKQVKATRLFEDYHPAGGPQITAFRGLQHTIPSFLKPDEIDKYDYFLEEQTVYGNHKVYKISFDQRNGVKEALAKGIVYITCNRFAVIHYEAADSPKGDPYKEHLKGTDKFFANLLNIEFERLSQKSRVSFREIDGKWYLNDTRFATTIRYVQEKKGLDLQLNYQAEILMTSIKKTGLTPITKEEEWQNNHLLLNLPSAWNASFWGKSNFITPETSLSETVRKMQDDQFGNRTSLASANSSWHHFNERYMYASNNADTIVLQAQNRCLWFRQSTGPMVYQNKKGDFDLQLKLFISQQTDKSTPPDKGFQAGGIIIRNPTTEKENHTAIWLGTRGNKVLKLSTQKTIDNKSKIKSEMVDKSIVHLRVRRQGNNISFYYRWEKTAEWEKIIEEVKVFPETIQLGLATFAHFSGNAPSMYPNITAHFIAFDETKKELSKNSEK